MKHTLDIVSDDGASVVLRAPQTVANGPAAACAVSEGEAPAALALHYVTRTGALLRVAGIVRGAFDREHRTVVLGGPLRGEITFEVERRALPTTGLPAGDGWRWKWLVANAAQLPERTFETDVARPRSPPRAARAVLALIGHSHLDVAWLWTYEETMRKALRTFATAVRQLESDAEFVFAQSQPQLYAWVAQRDPAFFARVRALARAGRLDTSGAAMWVEPDCNLPSGESLLRQLVRGMRYIEDEFDTTPTVAWLPDSFGFPVTLPTLLAHAGVTAFGTTKLGWNDTTTFPHSQFLWQGPDGSCVVAAQIASIEGDFEAARVRRARECGDALLIGHGDGGGGARDSALAIAPAYGRWTTLRDWFAAVARRQAALPVVRDELYLEEHRGTLTTHHDIKARNVAFEGALARAELALAWAKALHATPFFLDEARRQLAHVWEIVLRAQFHDVLPGSAIAAVYDDVRREYDEADALVAHVTASARSVLPRANVELAPQPVLPVGHGGGFTFASERLTARFLLDGTLVELRAAGGPNVVRCAQRLAAYVDRPKRWDAWNVDRGYRKRPLRVRVTGCEIEGDALEIRYAFGRSLAVARVSLDRNEPYLRVEFAVAWRERHVLLRVENELAFAATRARFGAPHGAVDRAPAPRTRAERAKFEACGQRYARVENASGRGLAVLALDTFGWSIARRGDRTSLGHSLLRGPTWPDPGADAGDHAFALAYLPFGALGMGELETFWERFAGRTDVPMFTCPDPALLVVATKLADDGDGIVVRARECDGVARDVALRCGARARSVVCVDALERAVAQTAEIVDGAIRAHFTPYQLRSFRVQTA